MLPPTAGTTDSATMTALKDIFTAAGFEPTLIPIPPPEHDPALSVQIYALRYRSPTGSANANADAKEPLLLLHGYPQNSNIYRRLGPALAKSSGRDIVIADSRGSGQSSAPKVRNFAPGDEVPGEDVLRTRYSKREMARDMFCVMSVFRDRRARRAWADERGQEASRVRQVLRHRTRSGCGTSELFCMRSKDMLT